MRTLLSPAALRHRVVRTGIFIFAPHQLTGIKAARRMRGVLFEEHCMPEGLRRQMRSPECRFKKERDRNSGAGYT